MTRIVGVVFWICWILGVILSAVFGEALIFRNALEIGPKLEIAVTCAGGICYFGVGVGAIFFVRRNPLLAQLGLILLGIFWSGVCAFMTYYAIQP